MKRRFMTFAGILNTVLFSLSLCGSIFLIYLGGKVVVETLQLQQGGMNGLEALVFVLSTLITGILLFGGIVACIFSVIMLVNSKAIIKKAKLSDESFSKKKKGIVAYIVFCFLIAVGCSWFLYKQLLQSSPNIAVIAILAVVIFVLVLDNIFLLLDFGKKIDFQEITHETQEDNQEKSAE